MKALQASRCAFITCVRHEISSRVLRLASYVNWYEPLGRVVKEPILFSIFGEAAEFFGSGVILVVR